MLATNGRSTYVIFIYKDIRWTTGDSSGGRRGFGGRIARAGINAGDGRTSLTITGSGTNTVVNLERMTNVRIPGMYILNVNQRSNTGKVLVLPDKCVVDIFKILCFLRSVPSSRCGRVCFCCMHGC